MRTEARCVIIGGGAMGVGLAYYLAHEGWTDTVLVEKGELTSGSTWHAAGLVPNFIGDLNMAKVHQEAVALYPSIEEETGLSAGWHGCGAVRLARTPDEVDWHRYVHAMLTQVGIESHLISPAEIAQLHPLLELDDVVLGFHTPADGWTDPTSCTNAMAKGARQLGCEINRHTLVTGMNQLTDGRWDVITDKGTIRAEQVVNAAGHYAPQLGAMIGLDVPIVSVIHQYLVTEPLQAMIDLDFEPPVVRDPRASCYYRREINGLLVGPYEMSNSQTYGVDGIDWDLHFHLTEPDLDVLEECIHYAMMRIPAFAEAGIKQVVSGPITHTPDSGYLLGPAPGVRNYWHCNGASIGITQGPGAGKYLAQWIVHGQTEINVRGMDPRRFGGHTGPKSSFAYDKARDEYHEMYQVRLPGEQRPAGRPQKTTPIYTRLDALGAQWQEVYGWERPQYFSPDGTPEHHTFRRSDAFDAVAAEVRGVRKAVGVADLTAFAKFEVTGSDAGALLDRLSANRLPGVDGGIRLVHMLTEQGGIECEMTITRLATDRFYLNSAIMGQSHDLDWLTQHMEPGEDVTIADVTDSMGLLAVTGPRARDLLAPLTDADLGNDSFRWLTGQEITVAGVPCIALRVSYVGELGWELHCPIDRMAELYDSVVAAGAPHGLVHFGSYAMNVMRLEKGYKAWGSELTTEITPIEARLERFVDFSSDFIGRGPTIERRDQSDALSMVLVYCEVDAADNDVRGNEPAFAPDGRVMGVATSGAWGHTVGKSLAFVYVDPAFEAPGSAFELDLLGERRMATVMTEPAYDPANLALRG
ncbi:MAG: FAD-dependent oxidoreductase [Actinomycetia bacterium]|nr:FAD-dependent oxidoreductase [Actinomycetes bacterium]